MKKMGPIEPAYKNDKAMQPRSLEADITARTKSSAAWKKTKIAKTKGDSGIFDETDTYKD